MEIHIKIFIKYPYAQVFEKYENGKRIPSKST